MLKTLRRAVMAVPLVSLAASVAWSDTSSPPSPAQILATYADIAHATYSDAAAAALSLQAAIGKLIAEPTDTNLAAARNAWKAARIPYQQSEAFRFGNKIVDDWEGRVNSWPLDEGLIDYVDASYGSDNPENPLFTANVIASKSIKIGGEDVDLSTITKEVLAEKLQEAGGVEANVATGYHAIEFLLWGQDLNGTDAGAGNRPATDFDTKNCTGGNCERRAAYLKAATELLVDDLSFMAAQWDKSGEARKAASGDGGKGGLKTIFTGLGSLSYGELAGERMKLGLLLHDPEEEHDCFSDNTHNSHYYDVIGIRNVYLGAYTRTDGSQVKGPSVSDLVRAKSPETDAAVRRAIDTTVEKMTTLKKRAEGGESYDQMIGQGNTAGNALVQSAIDALMAQAKEFERAMAALELGSAQFEGSDSLDDPGKVGTK